MRFLHISDTHYLKDYATNQDGFRDSLLQMADPLQQLQSLLSQVAGSVDFVIHSGDLTHDGVLGDYQALQQGLLDLLGETPLLTTLGNHDNAVAYHAVFAPEAGAVQRTQFAGLQVIGFDSAQEGNPNGAVTLETCQQLLAALEEHPTLPTILFTHHHVVPEQFELPSATVDALFQTVMERPQVVALLTGHTHHPYRATYCAKPYFTADTLSFVVDWEGSELVVREKASLQLFTLEGSTLRGQTITTQKEPRKLGTLNK